jgi:hypothetical protein
MVSTERSGVVGIIFPLLPEHIRRFFDGRKRVFVKFLSRQTIPTRVEPNSRMFFYRSRNNREVMGEAKIVEAASGTLEEVLSKFGEELFLTPTELELYVGRRKSKKMLVLVLEDVREYAIPLRLDKSVTMAGKYMTESMLKNLRTNS